MSLMSNLPIRRGVNHSMDTHPLFRESLKQEDGSAADTPRRNQSKKGTRVVQDCLFIE